MALERSDSQNHLLLTEDSERELPNAISILFCSIPATSILDFIQPAGTRQFIDKTTHQHGFWRQFTDTIEDNSSTLFEDHSPTHYYVEIIPKLIK